MTDIVDTATRSRMMAGIQGKNTRPELLLRSYLHRAGFRFRLHKKGLPGKPDLVLARYRTVIFVHGCYWHRHPRCRLAYQPKTRVDFWKKKFAENVERARHQLAELINVGWRVIVVWECGLRSVQKGEKSLDWLIDELRSSLPDEGILIEWPVIGSEGS